jgi:hypothetical protein
LIPTNQYAKRVLKKLLHNNRSAFCCFEATPPLFKEREMFCSLCGESGFKNHTRRQLGTVAFCGCNGFLRLLGCGKYLSLQSSKWLNVEWDRMCMKKHVSFAFFSTKINEQPAF